MQNCSRTEWTSRHGFKYTLWIDKISHYSHPTIAMKPNIQEQPTVCLSFWEKWKIIMLYWLNVWHLNPVVKARLMSCHCVSCHCNDIHNFQCEVQCQGLVVFCGFLLVLSFLLLLVVIFFLILMFFLAVIQKKQLRKPKVMQWKVGVFCLVVHHVNTFLLKLSIFSFPEPVKGEPDKPPEKIAPEVWKPISPFFVCKFCLKLCLFNLSFSVLHSRQTTDFFVL